MILTSQQNLLVLHVRLNIFPTLSHFEENGGVASNDDDAGHQEAKNHQKLLGRMVIFPRMEMAFLTCLAAAA